MSYVRFLSVGSALTALGAVGWAVGFALQPQPDLHLSYAVTTSSVSPASGALAVALLAGAGLTMGAWRQARRSWRAACHLTVAEG